MERGFPDKSSKRTAQVFICSLESWFYRMRIWICWIGEFPYPSDIIQTFWRNVCNIRCFAMVSCTTRWHISNFRPMKIDWTHAKICITRFHIVTQQLYTPEVHVCWIWNRYERLKKYQKVISMSLIAPDFIKLCGIMRRKWNYAIPHPCIIPWGLYIQVDQREREEFTKSAKIMWLRGNIPIGNIRECNMPTPVIATNIIDWMLIHMFC